MPFYLNSQPLPRLHGLQSAQITIASLAPNMPQWDSICPHPPSPTGLLLTGNLALCSMLAPSIARADGGALGAGGCRILKFPIKSAWFLYPLHTKNSRIRFQESSIKKEGRQLKARNENIFPRYWQQHGLCIRATSIFVCTLPSLHSPSLLPTPALKVK